MDKVITFEEMISMIEKRPLAFISHHSLSELEAFISGYNYHRFVTGASDNMDGNYKKFISSWLYARLKIVDKQGWKEAIMRSCENEEDAFQKFFNLWHEYMSSQPGVAS